MGIFLAIWGFVKPAFGFLIKRPLLLLAILLAIAVGWEHWRLSVTRDNLAAMRGKYDAAAKLIGEQNASIDKLKAKADAQQKKAASAAADASDERKRADKALAALRAEKVPKTCKGAVKWGAEKGLKLKW